VRSENTKKGENEMTNEEKEKMWEDFYNTGYNYVFLDALSDEMYERRKEQFFKHIEVSATLY